MINIVKILIFAFVLFLSTPTIVSLIENNNHISILIASTEIDDNNKDIKLAFKSNILSFCLIYETKKSCLIISENLSMHDKVSPSIFTTPPDSI